MANRPPQVRSDFAALLVIVAGLYALIFLTGTVRTPQLGLDLRGGTTVTLTAKTPNNKPPAQADLELARQIIEQRVNGLGVANAQVVTEGSSNIVISVPGDNSNQARELGATAQLRFRPVIAGPLAAAPAPASPSASASGPASASASAKPTGSAASASAGATASAAPTSAAPTSSPAAASSSAAP